jgi:hypothetical protein
MTRHPTIWRKSSYSVNSANCVELAESGSAVLMRDSKHPEHGHLAFSRAELAALIGAAKAGELDDLS